MELQKILFVGIGGFAGATMRYALSQASAGLFGARFPVGTLLVNALGGFLIGFIMEMSIATDLISPSMRLLLVSGVLGGFTTFSAFSWETVSLLGDGSYLKATVNIAANLIFSVGGAALGRFITNIVI